MAVVQVGADGRSSILVWFRRDLRVRDNWALSYARSLSKPIVAVFLYCPEESPGWELGGASRWWLNHSLRSLGESLEGLGIPLIIRQGSSSLKLLCDLCERYKISEVVWNRVYQPALVERDKAIKSQLPVKVSSFGGELLLDPWKSCKPSDGKPYRVFTPFWRNLKGIIGSEEPAKRVAELPPELKTKTEHDFREELRTLDLLPSLGWDAGFYRAWQVGEEAALDKLDRFINSRRVSEYENERNSPARDGTSQLSPHLVFGELSPRQVWQMVETIPNSEPFLRQLAWRDFARHLLFFFPNTPEQPLRPEYASFPWEVDIEKLLLWEQGKTGYPIVDAGMRQLWRTGWMHNRVRMIVGSLLVKHLLQPWQSGAKWFWDTLVDADLANNTLGWQWVAGCGADAAPYFRIFNPVLQGEKFDSLGSYVRTWVPELSRLPDKLIHKPWEGSAGELKQAGVELGRDYPRPIIGVKEGRERALRAYERFKKGRA